MRRKVLLLVLVLAGLVFAAYVVAQTFDTPTVSETEVISSGTGGTEIVPAVIGNESKETEIKKIDSDGDGMSDWFEENYTHTDPNIVNDRYALWLNTMTTETKNERDMCLHFFTEENRVPRENIVIDNSTTFSEFKEYIDWLNRTSDKNDFVYIHFHSHGGSLPEPLMHFADEQGNEYGKMVTYREIGKMLNQVKCNKMLVTTHSCAWNTSTEPLAEEAKYPRVVAAPVSNFLARGFSRIFKENKEVGDEYLTVEIWLYHLKKAGEEYNEETGDKIYLIKVSDKNNIAGDFYFGEIKTKYLFSGDIWQSFFRQIVPPK